MKKKILIVDDAEELLELTIRLLSARGYDVIPLRDGDRAVETIKKESPDLVIMDMLLPGKDGSEICHEIKSDEKIRHIPVIIATGQVIDEEITGADAPFLKADDYLSKPFEIEELLKKVNDLIS